MVNVDKVKRTGNRILSKFPKPIQELLNYKTDDEREAYLESIPLDKQMALVKWLVYILLSGDLIGKATKIGLKIPSDIKDFLEKVESEIRSAGKVTMKSVSSAVDNVMSTIKVAIAIPFIIFGAFLLLNPSVLAGLFISAVAIEASAMFFLAINPGWFSQKKGSNFKRDQESDPKKLDMSHES